MEVVVEPVLGNQADELLDMPTVYMESLYPSESNHLVNHSEFFAENASFIGAYVADIVVGCVAILFYKDEDEYGEIKRLFVLPESRNLKLGGLLMNKI
jgi:putative acetyltransferase